MKKFVRIFLWSVGGLLLLTALLLAGFIYKISNGFPVSYETEAPVINFPQEQRKILLFSKATGFRHGESIEAGKKVFDSLAGQNNWFLFSTEQGGVFNEQQLNQFDVVVFNNSTGRVLNAEQQLVLQRYVENGGSLIGIHGSGDNSHHWDWYVQNLTGVSFSHHPLHPQLQDATVRLDADADSVIRQGLPVEWAHNDEWYIFLSNPREKGFNILYTIDGEKIKPSGNLLWMTGREFGMGKDHPVAWSRFCGKGRTFYTSMGHHAYAWKQQPFVTMLVNAVNW